MLAVVPCWPHNPVPRRREIDTAFLPSCANGLDCTNTWLHAAREELNQRGQKSAVSVPSHHTATADNDHDDECIPWNGLCSAYMQQGIMGIGHSPLNTAGQFV